MFNLREVVLMDIDKQLLKDNLWKVKTIPYDHLSKRPYPLNVHVISADAKIQNYNLPDVDLLTMIEVIEHIFEEELPSLTENVFHIIQPKYVFVSTPNAEYNKFFVDFQPGQFRHSDHKFEWDSAQFRKWASIVGANHLYDVEFDGCGVSEEGTFCTQIAIFTRQGSPVVHNTVNYCNAVSCKAEVLHVEHYPFDQETAEQKIQNKIKVSLQSLYNSLFTIMKEMDETTERQLYKLLNSAEINSSWQELSELKRDAEVTDAKNSKDILSFTLRPVENTNSDMFKVEDNIFYYIYSEDAVMFLVATFYTWLEETHPLDFLRDALQSSVTFVDINGQNWMKIFLYDIETNGIDDC